MTPAILRRSRSESAFHGAGERFRTVNLVLGKHALYQLSYTRSPAAGRGSRIRSFIDRSRECQTAARRAGFAAGAGVSARTVLTK